MPITFTKARAYEMLKANGITDVLLHFTNRDRHGYATPWRQWTASRGAGANAVRLSEGRWLVEVVRDVIQQVHPDPSYRDTTPQVSHDR